MYWRELVLKRLTGKSGLTKLGSGLSLMEECRPGKKAPVNIASRQRYKFNVVSSAAESGKPF